MAKTETKLLKNLLSWQSTSTGGNLKEENRLSIADAMLAGCMFSSKVMFTKQTDKREGVDKEDTGGKPFVYMQLPEDMAKDFAMTGDSIVLWFHSSAKGILEETNNRLSKRMDVVEVFNEDAGGYSFIITATGAGLNSSTNDVKTLAD